MRQTKVFMDREPSTESQWKKICLLCGIAGVLAAFLGVFDIIFATAYIGGSAGFPKSAEEMFQVFLHSALLGLYRLDFLNAVVSLLLLFVFYGLFAALKNECPAYAGMALITAILGTALFICNHAALPMYGLSIKYHQAADASVKLSYLSAGEALLARGEHGGFGAFLGYFLSALAGLFMSFTTYKGKTFQRAGAYAGIAGHLMMLAYVVLVTFMPDLKEYAVVLAAPGGILTLAWLILVAVRLIKMGMQDIKVPLPIAADTRIP